MSSPPSAWTPARMLERLEGDAALARELMGLFLEEYGNLLRALRESADAGRPEHVRTAAHALKGCVGNFTDGAAYRTAHEIERRAASGGALQELPLLLHQLAGELDELAAQMRAHTARS